MVMPSIDFHAPPVHPFPSPAFLPPMPACMGCDGGKSICLNLSIILTTPATGSFPSTPRAASTSPDAPSPPCYDLHLQAWVQMGMRTYMSCPLVSSNQHRLGTLCFAGRAKRVAGGVQFGGLEEEARGGGWNVGNACC